MAVTFEKRQKEMKRQEKAREKAERRAQKKLEKRTNPEGSGPEIDHKEFVREIKLDDDTDLKI